VRSAEDAQREEVHAQDIDRLGVALAGAADSVREQLERLADATASSVELVESRLSALDSRVVALGAAIEQFAVTAPAAVERVETRLRDMDGDLARLAGALEELEVPEPSSAAEATAEGAPEEEEGPLRDIGAELLTALERLGTRFADFERRVETLPARIGEHSVELGRRVDALPEKMAEFLAELAQSVDALPTRLGEQSGELTQSVEGLAEHFAELSQRIDTLTERIADQWAATDDGDPTVEALNALTEEVSRLRRRLPVRKKPAE